ncbi:MAG TPA: M13 family metallopeptidase [Gammaproteobacteria bacterium]|nr:M13 family metallopeptidase [Gammaproteobacteria bacterium]
MRLTHYLLISLICTLPLATFAAGEPPTSGAIVTDADGLNLDWLDRSVNPAQNFFEYANGDWQKANPIPPAYSRWGTFNILQNQNEDTIHQILEDAAKNAQAPPGSDTQKIGAFFSSGMDEAAINQAGIKPLEPELDRINNIYNLKQLQTEIAHLQMIGVNALFGMGEMQDFKNSTKVIGVVGQGGLGLPDRDYYLKKDPKFVKIREAYVQHIARSLELLGDTKDNAVRGAGIVMDIETRLAKASMSQVQQRDPLAIYHVMNLVQLDKATPNFSWQDYFANIGHPEFKSINLAMPKFFKAMSMQLASVPLSNWKTYLRWQLVDAFAPYLSQPFVDENFKMQSVLSGAKELLPRWKRVARAENSALGFAIGKAYVEQKFPPSSKAAVLDILHGIRAALHSDLETISWMSPSTRKAAIKKLALMGERIGYPDKWRDYSALQIDRGPYALNVMRANEFENNRELNKIGKPVDSNEWYMTPQTVNAYYDPSMNNINFPAGILQPPFFDPKAPMAVNYGAIGFVMGHETTHGFDDQGSQFDGHGNLKNWWTKADKRHFEKNVNCIAKQFSKYTVDGNLHVQGKLVTGEAIADLGGLKLAWRAFHASPYYKNAKTIDGFTPDQQFFLGAAHVWASNIRPAEARNRVTTDPHPPAMYRVNGTMANLPQFQQAFHVPKNSPMVNKNICVIW